MNGMGFFANLKVISYENHRITQLKPVVFKKTTLVSWKHWEVSQKRLRSAIGELNFQHFETWDFKGTWLVALVCFFLFLSPLQTYCWVFFVSWTNQHLFKVCRNLRKQKTVRQTLDPSFILKRADSSVKTRHHEIASGKPVLCSSKTFVAETGSLAVSQQFPKSKYWKENLHLEEE